MIEILIPGLPKSPNELSRMHWAAKAKHMRMWRTIAAYHARKQRPKHPMNFVEITFVRGSSRRIDFDNGIASFKPILDGLRDAKIIIDDNPNVVRSISFDWEKAPPNKGYIKVIVQELD